MLLDAADARLARYRDDFPAYARDLLRIEPEGGGSDIPFVLNTVQRVVRRIGFRVPKLLILKGRGMGVTTVGLGELLHTTWRRPYTHATLWAHTDRETAKIFRRARLMEERLPTLYRPSRPSTATELTFPDQHSDLSIATAGAKAPARGSRLHFVWLSEAAYYPGDTEQQGRTLAGVLGATPQGAIRVESTANGVGGWFYETYMAARTWAVQQGYAGLVTGQPWAVDLDRLRRDPGVRSGSVWVPLFLPWWWDERKRAHLTPADTAAFRLRPEEREWAAPARVPAAAVAWRRQVAATYRPENLVDQEMPCSDLSAFVGSAALFFNPTIITARSRLLPRPIRRMDGGATLIWEEPQRGVEYLGAGDPSDGAPPPQGDFAHLTFFRRRPLREVARFHLQGVQPADLAHIAARLGRMYHYALFAPERNIKEFARRLAGDEAYENLYYDADVLRPGRVSDLPGVHTDTANRQMMLDDLRAGVEGTDHRPADMSIRDPDFWAEAATFRRSKKGRYEAAAGAHDDAIFGKAILRYIATSPGAGIDW